MPFREPSLFLRDIHDAVVLIQQFTLEMNFAQFSEDPKTVAAVERKLLVISEAAVRLGEEGLLICPDIPWNNVRGMGNWLRHQYDRVDVQTVWNTITEDLPPLKAAVAMALKPSQEATTPLPLD